MRRSVVVVALAMVALALPGGPVAAQDGPVPEPPPAVVASPVTPTGPSATATDPMAYWTPERLRAARPATARSRRVTAPGAAAAAEPAGPPRVQQPSSPSDAPDDAVAAGAVAEAVGTAALSVPKPYTDLPDRTVGKVFFSQDGVDYTCSGSALNSANRSVVWTAGHCVEGGWYGGWSTNFVYIPAYGSCPGASVCAPYGVWPAKRLFSHRSWTVDGLASHDHGAAVVRPSGGVRLVERTGGNGMRVNVSATQSFSAFGYPAEAPFTGRLQHRCSSATTGRDRYYATPPVRITCNMNGGSSGGPWLVSFRADGLGYLNGVTSYRLWGAANSLYSPYFGDAAWQVFTAARSYSPW